MTFKNFVIAWKVKNKSALAYNFALPEKDVESTSVAPKVVDQEYAKTDTSANANEVNTTTEVVAFNVKNQAKQSLDVLRVGVDSTLTNSSTKTLRKDADIYLQIDDALPYSVTLPSFLIKKGFIMAPFDENCSYLDHDVILLSDHNLKPDNGSVYYLSADKASLWKFLQDKFKGRF